MAAVLAAGEGAVLSHRSAGALWGVREWSSERAEVSAPRRRRPRDGIVLHEVCLAPDETTTHDAIPVTTPARTLLDLAPVLDEHALAAPSNEPRRSGSRARPPSPTWWRVTRDDPARRT